ncbi:hypothetical protein BANRA_01245 [Escherichia coli]|nr:hypothetical protein BANRA_01245 [Escherichia coli]
MYYTAKAILAGYKVAYVADAVVKHSHNYSPIDEFKRYFDIGVFMRMKNGSEKILVALVAKGKIYTI